MTSRSSARGMAGAAVGVAILAGIVLACGPAATPIGGTLPASQRPTGIPAASLAGRDAPPDALLAAEGGDPVAGQLGSFVWLDTGSDSPWLPGAPISVGAGEPLTVNLVPGGDVRAWAARYVPAAAADPAGATTLGDGSGSPRFEAPGPGAWTVEVLVEFAAGVGDASYFWRLEVE